jgi:hypothetical protein
MNFLIERKGRLLKVPVEIERRDGRIFFTRSPMLLKDEIKSMRGARWHGRDEKCPRQVWSIADCPRNDFRLKYLGGENAYAWFDRPLEMVSFERPLMQHQMDLVNSALTYHYQIWAAEMGTGKTLAAQEVIERSGDDWWYWIGPKTSLPNIAREFRKWEFQKSNIEFMTYDALVTRMQTWQGTPPRGIIFDESSRLKTASTHRTLAAQEIADLIRSHWGMNGFVILMSGTPSPKSPLDWWSQCEIAWPGFLREGSPEALKRRLAFQADAEGDFGAYKKLLGWRDSELKCSECGKTRDEGQHDSFEYPNHKFKASVNEVALLYERLKGLVVIKHKKDCLNLPDKQYRRLVATPTASVLRVAQVLSQTAPNAITAATQLRELSDGFQYREKVDGMIPCNHCESRGTVIEWFDPDDESKVYQTFADDLSLQPRTVPCPQCGGSKEMPRRVRFALEVACPKDQLLFDCLDECEETGRIVTFAGFTGSVDRITRLCQKRNWAVVRCDGRGFAVFDGDGNSIATEPLDYWADKNNLRVAFVAHPESGGMSLTLTEARMTVFWSNSFKPEYRIQAEDRTHRKGMDENKGCVIVDLIHLPSDERVLQVIQENRRLELMTLGEFTNDYAVAA